MKYNIGLWQILINVEADEDVDLYGDRPLDEYEDDEGNCLSWDEEDELEEITPLKF